MPKELSRLGIFVFFDSQGVVDRYVIQLLAALRPNFKRLIVISNIALRSESENLLKEHCDALYFRENKGLDAAAFKQGLTSFCGWSEVEKYDEVVLVNDTFFGPIHSFDEMFAEMANKDVDFWGMSAGYCQRDGWQCTEYGYIPEHIQTFFVAFRQNMVRSEAFQKYWNNYNDTLTTFQDVVTRHEVVMTKHFQDLGFRWDIYADTARYKSKFKDENFNLYFYHAANMMKEMKFPVIKRKVFSADVQNLLYMCDLGTASDAMKYITRNSAYESSLIWENILRLYNITDIYYSLNLNYVLSSEATPSEAIQEAALVFHIANPFFAKLFCERAEILAERLPVYLIPEGKEVCDIVNQYLKQAGKVKVLESTGQETEMGAFMLRCSELKTRYTYLGFVHDMNNPFRYPTTVLESTVQSYVQNVASDLGYISQILHCFDENPRLGVLSTPFPIHHHGFGTYGNTWGEWYADTMHLARVLKLSCNFSEEKQPIMNSGAFWCRTSALQPLWDKSWKASDFRCSPVSQENKTNEVLKRILPFVAQSEGYYSGVAMHMDYASIRITEQEFMLHETIGATKNRLKIHSDCYNEYIHKLQAYGADDSDTRIMVDLRQVGLRTVILILADRYIPKRVSSALLKFYRFCKRKLH